ncbi:MAG: transketolase [Deltaproteobacteria bacterium]|nr:transketolase [Deltaproteobacteria bacterium]
MTSADLDLLCINTIRTLALDAIEKADSGHPGLPLGAAPMAYVLWQRHLRHDPTTPRWPNRDRFVLSGGHGSMLLYGLLHLTGYDLSLDDLKQFRQWQSRTPGHPEFGHTPGVEATTGPLGQGAANAVGMAIAERRLASMFNRPGFELVDHFTYALVSDGDLMEGVVAEAASLAGHLKLGKLIFLYDDNGISLDGPTSITFTEDVSKRFLAYGWHVQTVTAGNTDIDGIDQAIRAAQAETARPSLIAVKTTIGFGSPNRAGTSGVHGSPLGATELELTKAALGFDPKKTFFIPAAAAAQLQAGATRGATLCASWTKMLAAYADAHPQLARLWDRALSQELPEDLAAALPQWRPGEALATRQASGKALNVIAKQVPWLIGGDADLSVSTNTKLADEGDFDGQSGAGRNLHFGVREHGMAGIANGISYHGGLRPFVATFFVFSDYMRPSVRLAALSGLPVIYVWTHDSIGLGEDGPTHQPVEHLAALRAIPNMTLLRPADPNETAFAWHVALQHRTGPVGLVLSRQKVPSLEGITLENVARGAYVLAEAQGNAPQVILIGTGAEVHLALGAQKLLEKDAIPTRVVSMPSAELFLSQPPAYRDAVLPPAVCARVAVEAGVTLGWERFVGDRGAIVGLARFGASAPAPALFANLGFTAEAVATKARAVLAR